MSIMCTADTAGPFTTDELFAIVYRELRTLAAQRLAREQSRTIQATELVNEVFLRLNGRREVPWESRGQFFSAAAESMRRVLVDRARRRKRLKRGRGQVQALTNGDVIDLKTPQNTLDLLAVDEALAKLAQRCPRHAELVKLRFFAGLTLDKAAQALGIAPSTADLDWAYARTCLKVELEGLSPTGTGILPKDGIGRSSDG